MGGTLFVVALIALAVAILGVEAALGVLAKVISKVIDKVEELRREKTNTNA